MQSELAKAVIAHLEMLQKELAMLDSQKFSMPSDWLSGSTIGQHSRHVVELLQCLLAGYDGAIVDYDKRQRDHQLENNKVHLIQAMVGVKEHLHKPDKPLNLMATVSENGDRVTLNSTYERELLYNLEHIIHHMALLKVAFNEFAHTMHSPTFGVAFSTMQYRQTCAQ